MKKNLLIAAGILAVGAGIAVAMVMLRPEPPKEEPPPRTPLVRTVPAEVRTGAVRVTGSGTVRPRASVSLAPQVSGQVVYVHPSLVSGGRVRQGQTLVRIDPADYENAVRRAQADVAQQQVGVLQTEEEAAIARAEYEQFQERRARRTTAPYAGIDADDYAARVVPQGRETTAERPSNGPNPLVLREPQLEAAQASLERARAGLEDAQLALARTTITAPFDGYVQSETVDIGSYVAPGQGLAEIYAADLVEVVVPLSDDEAALIPDLWTIEAGRAEQRIPAAVSASYGAQRYQWDAYVDRAEATLDDQTRTIDVILRVPAPFRGGSVLSASPELGDGADLVASQAPPLLVGKFVRTEIEGVALDRYLAVPRRALRRNDRVWTVVEDSLLRIVPVQVIQQVDEQVLITGDLYDGQPVITSDLAVVTDSMKVRLAEPPSSSQAARTAPADTTADRLAAVRSSQR